MTRNCYLLLLLVLFFFAGAPQAATAQNAVISFTLVNADTDLDIQPLVAGAVLNLATLPTRNLNIRANTSPAIVGSVVFNLTGAQAHTQTETQPPYALFSDAEGNYDPWSPAIVAGSYTLVATPYSLGAGDGTAGTPYTVGFSVVGTTLRTSSGAALTVRAYPNPSAGHFWVSGAAAWRAGTYTLFSALGTHLAHGPLPQPTGGELWFDFSQQAPAAGLYYLLLEGGASPGTSLRLIRE